MLHGGPLPLVQSQYPWYRASRPPDAPRLRYQLAFRTSFSLSGSCSSSAQKLERETAGSHSGALKHPRKSQKSPLLARDIVRQIVGVVAVVLGRGCDDGFSVLPVLRAHGRGHAACLMREVVLEIRASFRDRTRLLIAHGSPPSVGCLQYELAPRSRKRPKWSSRWRLNSHLVIVGRPTAWLPTARRGIAGSPGLRQKSLISRASVRQVASDVQLVAPRVRGGGRARNL